MEAVEWVHRRVILDAVAVSVLAYRQGDKQALADLEAFLRDVIGRQGADRVISVIRRNLDASIPDIIERVEEVLDEVTARWAM